MGRRRLDALEAEIRDTRGRLAALLARADRDYGLRAGLNGLLRVAAKPDGETAAAAAGLLRQLALPAAALALVAGFFGARRSRPPPEPPQGDKV